MTDLDGLLHAVLETPADDAARLIYADAMEESGHPVNTARAEFIRLQLADEGHERQRELLERWLPAWFGQAVQLLPTGWWAVGTFGDPTAFRFSISRGFIDGIANYGLPAGEWNVQTPWVFAETFSESAADLFGDHPLERIVIDVANGEELRIVPGTSDTSGLWTCRRVGLQKALCQCHTRDRLWERYLSDVVSARLFILVRDIFNENQATGVAIHELQRRRLSAE